VEVKSNRKSTAPRPSTTLRSTVAPTLRGVSDAPMTATDCGRKRCSRFDAHRRSPTRCQSLFVNSPVVAQAPASAQAVKRYWATLPWIATPWVPVGRTQIRDRLGRPLRPPGTHRPLAQQVLCLQPSWEVTQLDLILHEQQLRGRTRSITPRGSCADQKLVDRARRPRFVIDACIQTALE